MGSALAQLHSTLFNEAITAALSTADAVTEDKRYRQLKEGKSHPLWLLGHIANTNNLLVNMWCLEGTPMFPKDFIPKFSPDFADGIDPTPDPGFYPSWDETVALFKAIGESCVEGIAKLTDDELNGPLRGGAPDAMKERFGNVDQTIRGMALHCEYHRGQIAIINAQD
ncbi:MAG: DinB family protein [Candidatus Hydrogenedentota bacterium]